MFSKYSCERKNKLRQTRAVHRVPTTNTNLDSKQTEVGKHQSDVQEEESILIILLLAVMFSAFLPILMICAPYLLMDGCIYTVLLILMLVGPGVLLSTSNVHNVLPEGIPEYC